MFYTFTAPLPPLSTFSTKAKSVTISMSGAELSLPALQYSLSVARVVGNGQILCPNIIDEKPAVNTGSTTTVTNLEEFSVYAVTINTTFMRNYNTEVYVSFSNFTTRSASMYDPQPPVNSTKSRIFLEGEVKMI